jgi:hypothetical protein
MCSINHDRVLTFIHACLRHSAWYLIYTDTMNTNILPQDELERFHSIITESLQRLTSQQEYVHDLASHQQQFTPFRSLSQNQENIVTLLEALPSVSEKELEKFGHTGTPSLSSVASHRRKTPLKSLLDSTCSICMQPFLAILAEEETASVMESPAFYSGELGVTRLSQPWQCGHIFCRRELRIVLYLGVLVETRLDS